MKILFTGIWKRPTAYESQLIPSLERRGLAVERRVTAHRWLPMTRASLVRDGIVHVHWPEAALDRRAPAVTLALADFDRRCADTRRWVITAHNLLPHEFQDDRTAHWYTRLYRSAAAVVAHSETARRAVMHRHGVDATRCYVVPHGDLASHWDLASRREAARARLRWGKQPTAIVFGHLRTYKGIESIVERWRRLRLDARLAVCGLADAAMRGRLRAAAASDPRVEFRFGQVADDLLADVLAGADVAVFNYREILTSGAADLARSCGVPVLLPERLTSVDLDEPSTRVLRFDTLDGNFADKLAAALAVGTDWSSAGEWRASRRWEHVAELWHRIYDRVFVPF